MVIRISRDAYEILREQAFRLRSTIRAQADAAILPPQPEPEPEPEPEPDN
jgi:hypothetical protein